MGVQCYLKRFHHGGGGGGGGGGEAFEKYSYSIALPLYEPQ